MVGGTRRQDANMVIGIKWEEEAQPPQPAPVMMTIISA
jgi:hypothetical protein